MPRPILPLLDLVAICLVVFGLYLPRHRRGDMVVAYLVINIGVLSVAQVLDSRTASTGLGLGLFGLLSIIRLRSSDIDHQEVAYYFSSLALGLLGGLSASPDWLVPLLMAGIVAALFVGDHPRLFGRYRAQMITVDAAFTDERALIAHLEGVLGTKVQRIAVRKVDLVEDTTMVEVRYLVPMSAVRPATLRVNG
jgi:hypothetical protein